MLFLPQVGFCRKVKHKFWLISTQHSRYRIEHTFLANNRKRTEFANYRVWCTSSFKFNFANQQWKVSSRFQVLKFPNKSLVGVLMESHRSDRYYYYLSALLCNGYWRGMKNWG